MTSVPCPTVMVTEEMQDRMDLVELGSSGMLSDADGAIQGTGSASVAMDPTMLRNCSYSFR